MARWRLNTPHYLNVINPASTWDYVEQDVKTKRQSKRSFPVPTLLDPGSPDDCNYEDQVIVSNVENAIYPRDYVFTGEPTPDMTPLDDEAKAISKSFESKWKHPVETLPGNFGASLIADFEKQMKELAQKGAGVPVQPQSVPGASAEEVSDLKKQIADLTALVLKQQEAQAPIDTEEPLPEVDAVEETPPPPVVAKPKVAPARRI